jgi:hypothetical protein
MSEIINRQSVYEFYFLLNVFIPYKKHGIYFVLGLFPPSDKMVYVLIEIPGIRGESIYLGE